MIALIFLFIGMGLFIDAAVDKRYSQRKKERKVQLGLLSLLLWIITLYFFY